MATMGLLGLGIGPRAGALPAYRLDPLGGSVASVRGRAVAETEGLPRFDEGSMVTLVARPAVDVDRARARVAARLWAKGPSGKLRILERAVSPAETGTFVVRGAASTWFGKEAGIWTLYLVIGPPSKVDTPSLRVERLPRGVFDLVASCRYQPGVDSSQEE